MDSLDESGKDDLISRLLKSKSSGDENESNEDPMKHLTPEQIQILSQVNWCNLLFNYSLTHISPRNIKMFFFVAILKSTRRIIQRNW